MRIISGSLRGRKLISPKLSGESAGEVRPTAARTREAVFNLLTHHKALFEYDLDGLPGATVADICCGSGALGLEALSRGAERITFVDSQGDVLKAVQQSAETMKVASSCLFRRANATSLPPTAYKHRIAFVDPPYDKALISLILQELHSKAWLEPNALIVAECSARESLTPPETYHMLDQRLYGAAQISLLLYKP